MSDSERGSEFDAKQWAAELEEKRREKDEFFAEHPQSPIPPEERESFDGLAHYPPDPDYRVEATVELHDTETVTLETTADTTVEYQRTMTFTFELRGKEETLAVYEQPGQEPLFVPFRDKTTGQQTYSGGRYMELTTDGDIEDGDSIILDLNLAYAPFCAYSDAFACPLPPEENWLDVAIEAGERVAPRATEG